MRKFPVSVCMISGAEAHRIRASLASVADWTSEIIVVLNDNVQDGTEEIAREFGAKIFREPWKGHIAQKNSTAQKATQPWLLGLDADEVVSPELRDEMQKVLADEASNAAYAAFSFPRLVFCCGRWIRHGEWYPDRSVRLWRKGTAEWGGINPHDKLFVQGAIGKLSGDLFHYSAPNIDALISKISSYSDGFVRHRLTTGKSVSTLDLVFRPAWRFVRGYFLRLGFLDGWPGYYIAWYNAFFTATRYAKVREAELKSKTNETSTATSTKPN